MCKVEEEKKCLSQISKLAHVRTSQRNYYVSMTSPFAKLYWFLCEIFRLHRNFDQFEIHFSFCPYYFSIECESEFYFILRVNSPSLFEKSELESIDILITYRNRGENQVEISFFFSFINRDTNHEKVSL